MFGGSGGCSYLTIDCLVSLVRLRAFVLASLILALAHHGRFDAIFKLVKYLSLNHVSWNLFEYIYQNL